MNVAVSESPRVVKTRMMATAISEAIRPYSIAVAPSSLLRNLRIISSVKLKGVEPIGSYECRIGEKI